MRRSASPAPSAASSRLPEDADPARVDASFRDGVLHVTVAKRESSKPRQITIN